MSDAPLCPVEAVEGGTIEDSGPHFTQLDFANATIGGGVFRNGAVQEEIRFLICPELIVSRAIAEPMATHEALLTPCQTPPAHSQDASWTLPRRC